LRRYVWQTFPDRNQPGVTVLRSPVPPGEAQIDYGYLGRWLDPPAHRVRRVWAFVMVLACSHMFVRPVLSMDQSSWVAAHLAAWEFFGSVPERLVIDNLKTGVIKADLYDPKLKRAYAEMAAHYGCLIDPARAGNLATRQESNARCLYPGFSVAGPHVRQRDRHSGRRRRVVFEHRRHPGAPRPGRRATAGRVPTGRGSGVTSLAVGTVRAGRAVRAARGARLPRQRDKVLYSVPWRHIGKRVDARTTETVVEIFADGQLIKTWPARHGPAHRQQ
jgi:Integrase core domain